MAGFPRAHGTARRQGRVTATSAPQARDLKPASAPQTVPSGRDSSGKFIRGNGEARKRKARVGPNGRINPAAFRDAEGRPLRIDPRFEPFRRDADRYVRERGCELETAHGKPSSTVRRMVRNEADVRAQGEFLLVLLSARPGNLKLLAVAERLIARAETLARDSWQMSWLESKSRPPAANALPPWFEIVDGKSNDDEEQTENEDEAEAEA
jgi:hypothetical protein